MANATVAAAARIIYIFKLKFKRLMPRTQQILLLDQTMRWCVFAAAMLLAATANDANDTGLLAPSSTRRARQTSSLNRLEGELQTVTLSTDTTTHSTR